VNEKPLAAARSNILSMGLENHVETVLTAGLKGLPIDEINDIVMAGMGGELIAGMIAACPAARDRRIQFILQPMTKAERLRPRLCQMGFEIAKEEGVLSGGIFYTVMNVFYTGVISGPDMLYAWTGKLHQSKTPESRGMLIKIRGRLLEIANGLDCSRGGGRPFEYRDVISKIDSLLEGKNDIYG
jgi:tRNA (adenine22-N1)-methyltransferase